MASISLLLSSSRAPAASFAIPASRRASFPAAGLSTLQVPPPPPVLLLHSPGSAGDELHAPIGRPRHLRARPPACAPKGLGGYQRERIKEIRKKLQSDRTHEEKRMLWSFWEEEFPRAAKGEGRPGEAIPPEFDVPPRRGEGELGETFEFHIARILESPFSEWSLDDMDYMEFATQGLKLQRATGLPFTASCKVIPLEE